jgi:hypothetical protein
VTTSIYLDVPYAEKDEAKRLGARWDAERKAWFVPAGLDAAAFSRWLSQEVEMQQRLIAPIWIKRSTEPCWKCHRSSKVFAVSASVIIDVEYGDDDDDEEYEQTIDNDDDSIDLNDLESIDPRIEALFKQYAPGYRKDFSKTQDRQVYMNHCEHCDAKLGDFFLHSEPGGAFFPMTEDEDARLSLTEIFSEGEFSFCGSYTLKG